MLLLSAEAAAKSCIYAVIEHASDEKAKDNFCCHKHTMFVVVVSFGLQMSFAGYFC